MFQQNCFLIRQLPNNLHLMPNYFNKLLKNSKKKNLKRIIRMKIVIHLISLRIKKKRNLAQILLRKGKKSNFQLKILTLLRLPKWVLLNSNLYSLCQEFAISQKKV